MCLQCYHAALQAVQQPQMSSVYCCTWKRTANVIGLALGTHHPVVAPQDERQHIVDLDAQLASGCHDDCVRARLPRHPRQQGLHVSMPSSPQTAPGGSGPVPAPAMQGPAVDVHHAAITTPQQSRRSGSRLSSWPVANGARPAKGVKRHLDLVHDRRDVGQRLARASWRAGQHISPRQQDRNDRLLDARRRAEVDGCSAGGSELSASRVGRTKQYKTSAAPSPFQDMDCHILLSQSLSAAHGMACNLPALLSCSESMFNSPSRWSARLLSIPRPSKVLASMPAPNSWARCAAGVAMSAAAVSPARRATWARCGRFAGGASATCRPDVGSSWQLYHLLAPSGPAQRF